MTTPSYRLPMRTEEVQLLLLRGVISELPTEDQIKIKQARQELEAVLLKHGDNGMLALALIGCEEAAKP